MAEWGLASGHCAWRCLKTDMTDVGKGTMVGGVGGDGDGDMGDWRASLRTNPCVGDMGSDMN